MTLLEVVNQASGERLKVELEIGAALWLRNERGDIEAVSRQHLPPERWAFIEATNYEVSGRGVECRSF